MANNQNIEILDVTLRDGGYKNNFNFSYSEIDNIISYLDKIKVKNIEAGYKNGSFQKLDNIGITGLSNNHYLEYFKKLAPNINLVIILHPKNVIDKDIYDLAKCGVHLIRVCLPRFIDKHTVSIINLIQSLGIKIAFNITRVTEYTLDELKDFATELVPLSPDILYFADSNGHLTPEKTYNMFSIFKKYPFKLGFHPHNNLDLALGNSIAAINAGAEYIDASISGLGKGSGNLQLEKLIGYLASNGNDNYDLASALEAQKYITSLKFYDSNLNFKDFLMGAFNLNQEKSSLLNSENMQEVVRTLYQDKKVNAA